jgi:hypothetical protein
VRQIFLFSSLCRSGENPLFALDIWDGTKDSFDDEIGSNSWQRENPLFALDIWDGTKDSFDDEIGSNSWQSISSVWQGQQLPRMETVPIRSLLDQIRISGKCSQE